MTDPWLSIFSKIYSFSIRIFFLLQNLQVVYGQLDDLIRGLEPQSLAKKVELSIYCGLDVLCLPEAVLLSLEQDVHGGDAWG